MISKNIEEILAEDNYLPRIYFPTLNQPLDKNSTKGNYIFKNGETFKGRIDNKMNLQKGIYTWPNGQIYYGDLSPNNTFNKNGKIIFPNKGELTGVFNGDKNTIEKAIYKSTTKIYTGSFKNNKLNGKFIIKNKEESPHYLLVGNYVNGFRNGNFYLEKIYANKTVKISGNYKLGKKNGLFTIIIEDDKNDVKVNKELKLNYDMDLKVENCPEQEKIENKQYFNFIDKKNKICCMEIIEEKGKTYLLIGSYEYLIIYNIENSQINFNKKILLSKRADINDIIKTTDNKILICSNNNELKLININFDNFDKNQTTEKDSYKNGFELIQHWNGLQNSNNIFCIKELSNELIISGDCENIILWGKEKNKNNNNIINNKKYELKKTKSEDSDKANKSFIDSIIDFGRSFFRNTNQDEAVKCEKIDESVNIIKNKTEYEYEYEYKESYSDLTHTYSILEINKPNKNNNIIIAVPQPDSKSLFFFEIDDNCNIKNIAQIDNINSIPNRKNIMTLMDNSLFIACKNSIVIVDIEKYAIITNIMFETVTYISSYKTKYIIMGVMKSKNNYSYESFLIQKELLKNKNIRNVSDFTKSKFTGNIINACIYKNLIIAIGTDGKILLLY